MAKEAHPQEVLDELAAGVASAGLAPGYVLRGEELYFRNAALDLLRAAARAQNLEVCSHDTKEASFDVQRLQDDLIGGGLFSSGRLVIVQAPEDLLKRDEGRDRAVARSIQKFLAAKQGSIVLGAEGLRADNATVRALLAAGGKLASFRKLYDKPAPWERSPDPRRTEVCEWVARRAKALGAPLSLDQAALVIASVGPDLPMLESKLVELCAGGPKAFFAQLESMAPVSPFELAGQLARGELRASLLDLEGLFHAGFKGKDGRLEVKPDALREMLFNALRAHVRRGLAGAQRMASGRSAEQVVQELGIAPYQQRDFQAALGARDVKGWRAMQRDLGKLERKSREGFAVDANDLALFAVRHRRGRSVVRA